MECALSMLYVVSILRDLYMPIRPALGYSTMVASSAVSLVPRKFTRKLSHNRLPPSGIVDPLIVDC
jgi:hypothetical protein